MTSWRTPFGMSEVCRKNGGGGTHILHRTPGQKLPYKWPAITVGRNSLAVTGVQFDRVKACLIASIQRTPEPRLRSGAIFGALPAV